MPLRHRRKKKAPVGETGAFLFKFYESMCERIGSQLEVGCERA